MRRDSKTWVKHGNTFDWLEIYEPNTYFPFSTIIFKNVKYASKYVNLNINVNIKKY